MSALRREFRRRAISRSHRLHAIRSGIASLNNGYYRGNKWGGGKAESSAEFTSASSSPLPFLSTSYLGESSDHISPTGCTTILSHTTFWSHLVWVLRSQCVSAVQYVLKPPCRTESRWSTDSITKLCKEDGNGRLGGGVEGTARYILAFGRDIGASSGISLSNGHPGHSRHSPFV